MWARRYEKCSSCLSTRLRHMAGGLCSSCYAKQYQANPAVNARIKEQKRAHYERKGLVRVKEDREARWFGGMREAALARDGHMCVKCHKTKNLVVHHKDGEGRGSKAPNNELHNLETLCRGCHAALHGTVDRWAKHYDQCQGCSTTERKHNAKGLCWSCYPKLGKSSR